MAEINSHPASVGGDSRGFKPGVRRYAVAFVLVTFSLVMLGGTVTSKGVGLAVPDWPTTYGYNMFLFPPDLWVGGIFWEHSHRLLGSAAGLMTIIMAFVMRRSYGRASWRYRLSLGLLVLVVIQGLMGGFRVTFVNWYPPLATPLAVFHGISGQVFLSLTVLLAASTGKVWAKLADSAGSADDTTGTTTTIDSRTASRIRLAGWAMLAAMVIQLVLGAAMRHTNSGLAIPDFPTAYGGLIPPMGQQGIDDAMVTFAAENESYAHIGGDVAFSPAQVGVHFAHRIGAVIVMAIVIWGITVLGRSLGRHAAMSNMLWVLAALLFVQPLLGAIVIWAGRHPETATAHQSTGAIMLCIAVVVLLRSRLLLAAEVARVEAAGQTGRVGQVGQAIQVGETRAGDVVDVEAKRHAGGRTKGRVTGQAAVGGVA